MALSVIIPYRVMEDATNLRNCLRTLKAQTTPAREIIVVDDTPPSDDQEERVPTLCDQFNALWLHVPPRDKPQWAYKFNKAIEYVDGDKVLLLCANWLLAPYALQIMERGLDTVGPGYIVVSDSQRQQMSDGRGTSVDWFKGVFIEKNRHTCLPVLDGPFPLFRVENYSYIDSGFLTAIHKVDWLPWDEEFDEVGGWHAVIEWGYRLMEVEHKRLVVLRGIIAWHQPTRFTEVCDPGPLQEQTKASQRLLARKVPGVSPE